MIGMGRGVLVGMVCLSGLLGKLMSLVDARQTDGVAKSSEVVSAMPKRVIIVIKDVTFRSCLHHCHPTFG